MGWMGASTKTYANLRHSERSEEGSGGGLISQLSAVAIPVIKVTLIKVTLVAKWLQCKAVIHLLR